MHGLSKPVDFVIVDCVICSAPTHPTSYQERVLIPGPSVGSDPNREGSVCTCIPTVILDIIDVNWFHIHLVLTAITNERLRGQNVLKFVTNSLSARLAANHHNLRRWLSWNRAAGVFGFCHWHIFSPCPVWIAQFNLVQFVSNARETSLRSTEVI